MIKFFRKIRFNLLEKNKTGKYFKYAIGEIILVAIGILIALSINNWNESKKLKAEEIEILNNFRASLINDKIDINWNINYHEDYVKNDSIVLNYLSGINETQEVDIASLLYRYLGTNSTILLSFSNYEQLKNRDPKLISNTKLFQQISDLYVSDYPLIIDMENYNEQYQPENQIEEFVNKHLTIESSSSKVIIKDIQNLKNDQKFELSLLVAIDNRSQLLKLHKRNLTRVDSLITHIERYLKTKG
jgi:hypothetical protein